MKYIYLILITGLLFCSANAQKIDRSKPPKSGPAPVITIPDPVIYKMANGITVLVVENHKLPKVSASYAIDAGPITEGDKAGVMGLMGAMLNEGTTAKTKAVFDKAVDQIGASVSLHSKGASVSALTRYFEPAFMLAAEALQKPAFDQASFDKLKSQSLTSLKSSERNVQTVSSRVSRALVYGPKHPNGEFQTEEILQKITLDDVKKYYAQYITPSRGFLVFVGDIQPEAAKTLAEKAFGSWSNTALTLPVLAEVPNAQAMEIDLIDMPNAVQSEIKVVNLVSLPLNDPDYFAALIANDILGGGDGYLFKALREKRGFTYGAYSNIGTGRYQTTFSASASVRTAKTDSAVIEFVDQIKKIRNEKVNAEQLSRTKALFNGSFALGMENPERIASFATNILLNNLPKDFYRTYLQKINAVTVADVQRVAQKYFNIDRAKIVITGNSSEMADGLKKLGYPVNMYDKYAAPLSAQASDTGTVDSKKIITDYLTAIGGVEELKKVNSISMKMNMEIQGMDVIIEQKKQAPNKELVLMSMGGNVVMKQVFDGEKGYAAQGPNKIPMQPDEIKDRKTKTNLFEQIDYVSKAAYTIKMAGKAKVAGKEAYKLTIQQPSGKIKTEYYDISSKLLVKEETSMSREGMTMNQTIEYDNFKPVGKITLPYKVTMTIEAVAQQQIMEMNATEVKVNEGVSADDFK